MSTSTFDLQTEIRRARHTLLPRRNDWRSEPGYVFPGERNTWLADLPTRKAGLRLVVLRHHLILELCQARWSQGNLPAAIFFSLEGATVELERQLLEANEKDQSGKRNLFPVNSFQLYPIFEVQPPERLGQLQIHLEDRLTTLSEHRRRIITGLENSPAPGIDEESLRNFWLPLGTALVLECEEQTLARYSLWLHHIRERFSGTVSSEFITRNERSEAENDK
ncbi:MAG TPA: hypothetical protein VH186_23210 [Chloroflexia bacterium]|nr:hypothetical protein [Chloroflexia bacterium]